MLFRSTQAQLLRVIQEGEYLRLGDEIPRETDVRIIAATNRDLLKGLDNKEFREDLYYRLAVIPIRIPPLRERKEDIPMLADHILHNYCRDHQLPKVFLNRKQLDELRAHSWPGNVREMRNVLERLVLVKSGSRVTGEDLMACGLHFPAANGGGSLQLNSGKSLEELEKAAILQALQQSDWVQKDAAELLKISVDRMNARIKKFGITHPKWKIHKE
mgnify:CR=1 FL=1